MKQITLKWDGQVYEIKENEAFEIASELEEFVSLNDLQKMSESPRFTLLARCLATMLNFGGASVTPSEVHKAMLAELKGGENAAAELSVVVLSALIEILMDGAPDEDEEPVGNDDSKEGHSLEAATS